MPEHAERAPQVLPGEDLDAPAATLGLEQRIELGIRRVVGQAVGREAARGAGGDERLDAADMDAQGDDPAALRLEAGPQLGEGVDAPRATWIDHRRRRIGGQRWQAHQLHDVAAVGLVDAAGQSPDSRIVHGTPEDVRRVGQDDAPLGRPGGIRQAHAATGQGQADAERHDAEQPGREAIADDDGPLVEPEEDASKRRPALGSAMGGMRHAPRCRRRRCPGLDPDRAFAGPLGHGDRAVDATWPRPRPWRAMAPSCGPSWPAASPCRPGSRCPRRGCRPPRG